MKSDTVYKRAHNAMLDLLAGYRRGEQLPSENELSATLAVSRTTITWSGALANTSRENVTPPLTYDT